MVELFANSEDPDQKQPSVASNVGLHCLSSIYLSIYLSVASNVGLHCLSSIYLSICLSTPLSVHYLFFKRYELTKLGTS